VGSLREDLQGAGIEVRETHISLVFLGERTVYKVKKPVSLSFLDFRELDDRKRACEAEVVLNQRLAPGVYRGVVPIVRGADGVHRLGTEAERGAAVEWAVEMARLPDDQAAHVRLAQGRLGMDEIERIARVIADFHARAATDARIATFGAHAVIEGNVRENLEQTREGALTHLGAEALHKLSDFQLGFLARNAELPPGACATVTATCAWSTATWTTRAASR
jgi:aminoglycoside phosphotransferase family enzyme